jgi:hypothetical protein
MDGNGLLKLSLCTVLLGYHSDSDNKTDDGNEQG